MSDATRQLHLNLFVPMSGGHADGAWRQEDTDIEQLHDIEFHIRLAQLAERGKFDSLFIADVPYLVPGVEYGAYYGLEPLTLLSAIASRTDRIGLIATGSTTFTEPYNLARQFASLDHLSNGRAGWNIVTTLYPAAARNFGADEYPDHDARYDRAKEFVAVVTQLWDSWQDDAVINDRNSGRFADMSRIHEIAYQGKYFSVAGPLNISRPPQGHPVLVQAGASSAGRSFAGRYAEAVFTAQDTIAEAKKFYRDVKLAAKQQGRQIESVRILPGIVPVIGDTEKSAKELHERILEFARIEEGLANLQRNLSGLDMSQYDLDSPFPDLGSASHVQGGQSRFALVVDHAIANRLTLRQVLQRLAGGHGHRVFVGTPEQFALEAAEWLQAGALDGFTIMPSHLMSGLATFVDHVVPELQKRYLFRTDYEGTTLRDHFNLARPPGRFSEAVPTVSAGT